MEDPFSPWCYRSLFGLRYILHKDRGWDKRKKNLLSFHFILCPWPARLPTSNSRFHIKMVSFCFTLFHFLPDCIHCLPRFKAFVKKVSVTLSVTYLGPDPTYPWKLVPLAIWFSKKDELGITNQPCERLRWVSCSRWSWWGWGCRISLHSPTRGSTTVQPLVVVISQVPHRQAKPGLVHLVLVGPHSEFWK